MIVSERDVMRYQPHTWHGWLRIKVEGTLKGDTFCYHKVTGTLAHYGEVVSWVNLEDVGSCFRSSSKNVGDD